MSIQVKHITKQFANFQALDNVSLEFPTGKLVALFALLAVVKLPTAYYCRLRTSR